MIGAINPRTDFCAETFAGFGTVIDAPRSVGQRHLFPEFCSAAGLVPQFHTNAVAPVTLPHVVRRLERHPHAAQGFVPQDVSRYLLTVAPSDHAGHPVLAEARCFVVPGTVGVIYAPNVWHAGMTVLDRVGHFAVLMWRGAADDDVFIDTPELRIESMSRTDTSRHLVEDA